MPHRQRDGLEWDDHGLDLKPRWARQPQLGDIARVCRRVLGLSAEDRCLVTFHAEGAFNKVYLVESPGGTSVLRVSLPVDPKYKTLGEVTTLGWIRRMTRVPVPRVIAFDDSQDNEIGFEWILMERMAGVPAYKRWRKLSMAAKTWVVEQVADFQSQLFRRSLEDAKFRSIGTLFPDNPVSKDAPPSDPKPGRIVSPTLFMGDHFNYDIARGPFRSSHAWLSAQLSIIDKENTEILRVEEDEDEREDAEDCLRIADKLTRLLPSIFPPLQQHAAERTVLWHDDLSLANILVDDGGRVTALIDWECVSCKPSWRVAEMPRFLVGKTREEEPDRDGYGDASSEDGMGSDGLDDEGKTELYWDHLMEYEQTQLRKVYVDRMKQLWPQWETEEVGSVGLKLDFYGAVGRCGDGWYLKRTEQWIDAVDGGACPRLMDVLTKG